MPDTRDLALGATVKIFRSQRRLTQQNVSKLMKIHGHHTWHTSTVSMIEHGRRRLRMSEAGALSKTLGVPVKKLLEAANAVDRGLTGIVDERKR
jgi:transcriptional regulator with XRE-family HTH domain